MPDPVPLPSRDGIAESIEDYLAECRARGLRAASIRGAYGWVLRGVWLPWCAERGLLRMEQVDQHIHARFVADQRDIVRPNGKRLSPHTIDTYSATVARWLRWAAAEGLLPGTVRTLGRRNPGRVVREVITQDEVDRMRRAADNDRDRLILDLLWDTAMRASELLQLRIGDRVRYDGRTFLRVLAPWRGGGAKGSRERLVPLLRPRDLQRYIDGPRAKLEATSDHIFVSRRRRGPDQAYRPLSVSGLEQVIRNLAEDAGIERAIYPHLFRHSAITRWRRQGLDGLWIITVAGHSSLAMLERTYDQTNPADAYDALARVLAPRDGR